MKTSAPAPVATVDAQNPWLGLVSFTEETRGFFHGREEEVAELGRRVQRKLLTVLFGQSGLGKTSILQAGLVPRLRPEGFCPVYVRLDYDPHSPSPAEQIKRAVFRATEAAGTWTKTGTAVAGETLWEFLHHRDDVLKDRTGRTLIPILIFDQFEEIFTLAQTDDAGRRRAQEFLADLADLVENRPPAALEARIDRDEADAARFDFARADYRILISLREDYLAHLEGLKAKMPSVTQNRMRLARMTGAQAVAAVRAPAPQLVGEAVAEAVVRFVAGGADLAHAEVEPSLLSLICRELNNTRIAQGHAEISADLLAGSRDTILSEFYERALADQPPGVRIFIEDEMLTDSGFRESVAEERVRKGFAAAGAQPGALAQLVDRRLLRVEDRLDLRRVEITHDVLCSVVAASRAVRHEREALEESKRQIAAQQERERATHRALVRARIVAAVAVVVMLGAVGSAVFGWINLRRARAAEAQSLATRELAERARGESEKLIGFLLEDFYQELRPTGRVEIVGRLADKAVAYYEGLPSELQTPQTRLYRALALVRKATALGDAGKAADADRVAAQAKLIFEGLRAAGDKGNDTTLGLALALVPKMGIGPNYASREDLLTAANLLRPLIASGQASRGAKLAQADILQNLAHHLSAAEGARLCEESRQILADMGALNLSDLAAAGIYGDVTDSQSRMEQVLGRLDEAQRLSELVGSLAEKVLAQRPGDLRAMKNRFYSADLQSRLAEQRHDYAKARTLGEASVTACRNYILFNPEDSSGWEALGLALMASGNLQMEEGRVSDALQTFRTAATLHQDPRNKTGISSSTTWAWGTLVRVEAQSGYLRSAQESLAELRKVAERWPKERGFAKSEYVKILQVNTAMAETNILLAAGDYAAAHQLAAKSAGELDALQLKEKDLEDTLILSKRLTRSVQVEASLRLGNAEEAATLLQDFIKKPLFRHNQDDLALKADLQARAQVQLGRALTASGQMDEARRVLGEAEKHYRELQKQGERGTGFTRDFTQLLYRLALAQPEDAAGRARRKALLAEAAQQFGTLSFEVQQLKDFRELADWIQTAQRSASQEATQ